MSTPLLSPSRRALWTGIAVAAAAAVSIVWAPASHAGVDINPDASGIMLHGYDPVAYFTTGQPAKGQPEFTATHHDGRYAFASAANRDAFVKDPAKYAPQYGGYCAMGMALGRKLDVDPNQWKIVDGKLYLNVSADAAKAWNRDVPGNIAKANANWPNSARQMPLITGTSGSTRVARHEVTIARSRWAAPSP